MAEKRPNPITNPNPARSLTFTEAASVLGCGYYALDKWERLGVFVPTFGARGETRSERDRGKRRAISPADLFGLLAARAAFRSVFPHESRNAARAAIAAVREAQLKLGKENPFEGRCLILTPTGAAVATPEEARELRRINRGQVARFNLEAEARELRRKIGETLRTVPANPAHPRRVELMRIGRKRAGASPRSGIPRELLAELVRESARESVA